MKVCVGMRMPGFELGGDIESKVLKKDGMAVLPNDWLENQK